LGCSGALRCSQKAGGRQIVAFHHMNLVPATSFGLRSDPGYRQQAGACTTHSPVALTRFPWWSTRVTNTINLAVITGLTNRMLITKF
jgi:hypothetical protein